MRTVRPYGHLIALIGAGVMTGAVDNTWAQADVKPSVAINLICAGIEPGKSVDYREFAAAVAAAAGVTPADLNPTDKAMSVADYNQAALVLLRNREVQRRPAVTANILALVADTEDLLADNSPTSAEDAGLKVEGAGHGSNWLFQPDNQRLTCVGKGPPKVEDQYIKPIKRSRLALRGKVEALGLIGEERKTADAFKFGYKREISEQDDGSSKTDRTETFDGVLGLRLSPDTWTAPVFAYADYSLSRARKKPEPPLDPGKAVDDDDTNAWELGFSTAGQLFYDQALSRSVLVDARIGWVSDDIKASRRAVVGLGATPGFAIADGKPCGLGGFAPQTLGVLKFRVRCRIRFEAEASYVDEAGKADFKTYGKFLAGGATIGFDIAPPMGDDAGIITSVSYRYLPVISGRAPDVHRLDTTVKYRFWLENGLGLDLGLTYGKGRETKTYKDEDKIEAGVGVLF
ncbi:hypothetical protein [Caulobacter sp. LARHSG274]